MRWTISARGLRRFVAASLLPIGIMAPPPEMVPAQDSVPGPDSRPFEAARGAETSTSQRLPASNTAQAAAPRPIVLNRAQRRDLEQARRGAGDLADQSASALERGLMPFTDYLEQESLVQWTEQVLTDVQFSGNPVTVSRNHLARMQAALERLRQFNQPNAKRWEADVALAEWAVADAELQLARSEQNAVATGRAALRRSEAAQEHRRLRQRDADIGWASLQATSMASSLTVPSGQPDEGGSPEGAADHRTYLTLVAERTADWSRDGAGIGRADRVQKSELAVDLVDLDADLRAGRKDQAKRVMRRADQRIRDLFATQEKFYGKGTASLYDLSRTWMAWRELHQMGAGEPDLVEADQSAEREQARVTLSGLADQTLDRRGRHAADVTVVRLVEQMDELESLRRPAGQSGDYLK